MIKFMLFIALIGLFGLVFLGVLMGRVISFFGGSPKKNRDKQHKTTRKSQSSKATDKKFSKGEGEYVDYEEVKE